jgi:hypothetical protein
MEYATLGSFEFIFLVLILPSLCISRLVGIISNFFYKKTDYFLDKNIF